MISAGRAEIDALADRGGRLRDDADRFWATLQHFFLIWAPLSFRPLLEGEVARRARCSRARISIAGWTPTSSSSAAASIGDARRHDRRGRVRAPAGPAAPAGSTCRPGEGPHPVRRDAALDRRECASCAATPSAGRPSPSTASRHSSSIAAASAPARESRASSTTSGCSPRTSAAAIGYARDREDLDRGRLGAVGRLGELRAGARRRPPSRWRRCGRLPGPVRAGPRDAALGRHAAAATRRRGAGDRMRMLLGREPRGVAVGGRPGEAAILVREDAAAGERGCSPGRPARSLRRPGRARGRRHLGEPRRPAPAAAAPRTRCGSRQTSIARCSWWPAPRTSSARPAPPRSSRDGPPRGELETFECGHFDLYAGRSIAVEADFLARHLGTIRRV